MKKFLKKGLCLVGIYTFAVSLVFLMGERITKLENGSSDFRNNNGSACVTFNK